MADDTPSWQTEARELLARAAATCAEHGVDLDSFVQGAVSAYFAARPGLEEHIRTMHLVAHLEAMRRSGQVATA
jgi:hypothetical protein